MSQEYHFKFSLLGECEAGKTAIKKILCDGNIPNTYRATLGVEDGMYRGESDLGRFRIIFYDTSGQERFRAMSYSNLPSCQAVFFVFDVNNPSSLEALETRIKDVCERKDAHTLQKVLLVNKTDLLTSDTDRSCQPKTLELAKQYTLKMLECSALSKESVVKAIHETANDLISLQLMKSATTEDDASKGLLFSNRGRPSGPVTILTDRIIVEETEDMKESRHEQDSHRDGQEQNTKTYGMSTMQQSETINHHQDSNFKSGEKKSILVVSPSQPSFVVPEGSKDSKCDKCQCKIF